MFASLWLFRALIISFCNLFDKLSVRLYNLWLNKKPKKKKKTPFAIDTRRRLHEKFESDEHERPIHTFHASALSVTSAIIRIFRTLCQNRALLQCIGLYKACLKKLVFLFLYLLQSFLLQYLCSKTQVLFLPFRGVFDQNTYLSNSTHRVG